ncbi:MAG: DUF192 domain-containing protein [Candidatus Levybacteria bacterium]|nr:DUF192 domain-containing protein [Candidatus Levybacteria bacterium]
MRTILILAGVLIILVAAFLFTQGIISNGINPFAGKKATATFDDKKITVLVAETDKEKQKGLSQRKSLPQNQGMVFVFDKPDYYPFWMKDMQFPIDIIFLRDNKIVTIHKNVKAPSAEGDNLVVYTPKEPANQVLELNAGKADEWKLQEGDTIQLSI